MISERADEAEQLYLKALKKNMDSPSALFGLALAHQMSGKFDAAVKRYTNFIDLYSADYSEAAALAEEYLDLALEHFDKPPGWRRVFSLAMMNDF